MRVRAEMKLCAGALRRFKFESFASQTYLRKDSRMVSIVLSRDQLEKMGRAL